MGNVHILFHSYVELSEAIHIFHSGHANMLLHHIPPPRGTRTATKGRLAPVMGTSEWCRTWSPLGWSNGRSWRIGCENLWNIIL